MTAILDFWSAQNFQTFNELSILLKVQLFLIKWFKNDKRDHFNFPIVIFPFICKATRRMPLVKQELLPFRSTKVYRVFRGVRVGQSLVFYVVFCKSLFAIFFFYSFGHCIVCPSIYSFWLPIWHIQTFIYSFHHMILW